MLLYRIYYITTCDFEYFDSNPSDPSRLQIIHMSEDLLHPDTLHPDLPLPRRRFAGPGSSETTGPGVLCGVDWELESPKV